MMELRKKLAGFLIITLSAGLFLPHMTFMAEAETGTTVTMSELYRYNLEIKKGATVTVESAEELRMCSIYSWRKGVVKNPNFSDRDIIEHYYDHGESEQFHSDLKTDMHLERLPSGKIETYELVLEWAILSYNLLHMIG